MPTLFRANIRFFCEKEKCKLRRCLLWPTSDLRLLSACYRYHCESAFFAGLEQGGGLAVVHYVDIKWQPYGKAFAT